MRAPPGDLLSACPGGRGGGRCLRALGSCIGRLARRGNLRCDGEGRVTQGVEDALRVLSVADEPARVTPADSGLGDVHHVLQRAPFASVEQKQRGDTEDARR